MRIKVAESAGFCWGVKRAMDQVMDLSSKRQGPIYTYGPLIHNRQVMEQLEAKSVHTIDGPEELPTVGKDLLVIRAHGVTPDTVRNIKSSGVELFDATCPLVVRVQKAITRHREKDYDIVIVGDRGHAETIGLMGYTGGRGHVVEGPEEVAALPSFERVCVVSQTTQADELFERTAQAVAAKAKVCKTVNTICAPTHERQEDTIELAKTVDTLVVVGGRHSANTVRLVKIAEELGRRTVHVETEEELNASDFAECEVVGVTAGASTPEWMITRVVDRLEQFAQEQAGGGSRSGLRKLGSLLVHTNTLTALGAAGLTWTTSVLLGLAGSTEALLASALSALFVLAMYTANRLVDRKLVASRDAVASLLYRDHPRILIGGVALATLGAVAIAFALGPWPFGLTLAACGIGTVYGLKIIPMTWRVHLGIKRLRDIPASKDISTAAGWTLVAAGVPWLAAGRPMNFASLATAGFVFALVLARSLFVGMREAQGDRIIGKEIVFNLIGRDWTLRVFGALLGVTLISLSYLHFYGANPWLPVALGVLIPYVAAVWIVHDRKLIKQGILSELLVDGQFLLAAGVVGLLDVLKPV